MSGLYRSSKCSERSSAYGFSSRPSFRCVGRYVCWVRSHCRHISVRGEGNCNGNLLRRKSARRICCKYTGNTEIHWHGLGLPPRSRPRPFSRWYSRTLLHLAAHALHSIPGWSRRIHPYVFLPSGDKPSRHAWTEKAAPSAGELSSFHTSKMAFCMA